MKLLDAYAREKSVYILGIDNKQNHHGVFCWSMEQAFEVFREWLLPEPCFAALSVLLVENHVDVTSAHEPQSIHGVGAALIGNRFLQLMEVEKTVRDHEGVRLEFGHIYFCLHPMTQAQEGAAVFLCMTQSGEAVLLHARTKGHVKAYFDTEPFNEKDQNMVLDIMSKLPEIDPLDFPSMLVKGKIIERLIAAAVIDFIRMRVSVPAALIN